MPVLFSRHDPPNMDRVRRPSLNSKCWRYGIIGRCPNGHGLGWAVGAYKIRPFFNGWGSPASGPDANERPVFPIAANRWTGNGTNSARPVEKLRSCGNRRVEMRSLAKGWKPT